MSGDHVTEIRRRILVENPVIVRFMESAMKTEKLVTQLQREYATMREIIKYVKGLDKKTAKNLTGKMLYQEFTPAVKKKARKAAKEHVAPVSFDNVIQFPRQKKSTKAA